MAISIAMIVEETILIQIENKEDKPTCVIYRADGQTEVVHNPLYPDDAGWLGWVQRQVGGYVERYSTRLIPYASVVSMWVNEEGLLLGLPINQAVMSQFHVRVVGDVVIYIRT